MDATSRQQHNPEPRANSSIATLDRRPRRRRSGSEHEVESAGRAASRTASRMEISCILIGFRKFSFSLAWLFWRARRVFSAPSRFSVCLSGSLVLSLVSHPFRAAYFSPELPVSMVQVGKDHEAASCGAIRVLWWIDSRKFVPYFPTNCAGRWQRRVTWWSVSEGNVVLSFARGRSDVLRPEARADLLRNVRSPAPGSAGVIYRTGHTHE